MTQEPLFLTVRQATDRLNAAGVTVKKETVQRWCRDGKIKSRRMPGGQYMIRQADIDSILATAPEAVADWLATTDLSGVPETGERVELPPLPDVATLPDDVATNPSYDYDGEGE